MKDPQQALRALHFGRVDAETDYRLATCFIGTEMLRQALLPQHGLFVGAKGAGKSALFKLLCNNLVAWKPLVPKGFDTIYRVPATGLQSERYLSGVELAELSPKTVNDFRDFWLLYVGLKTATTLVEDERMQELVEASSNARVKENFATLLRIVRTLGLVDVSDIVSRFRQKIGELMDPGPEPRRESVEDVGMALSVNFRNRTGIAIIRLLDIIDALLQDTQCAAWILLDKLDLLYFDNFERLRTAVTGLVQLLIEYSDRFRNIQFKVFLRRDIYQQLRIVNKSHLVSYTNDMRWRGSWLMKLLVARAVSEPVVCSYCETTLGEAVDVAHVINGSDEYVLRVFYTIFESNMRGNGTTRRNTHRWILRRLVDGLGMSFPREIIHLGNLASARQRELHREGVRHRNGALVSARAIREAFEEVSLYRCETYLNAEFPHLARHIDVFRGNDASTYTRAELHRLFEGLGPSGNQAIRMLTDVGLLGPVGGNVDAAERFTIPLLYRSGLGISRRKSASPRKGSQRKRSKKPSQPVTTLVPELPFDAGSEAAPPDEEANIPANHLAG